MLRQLECGLLLWCGFTSDAWALNATFSNSTARTASEVHSSASSAVPTTAVGGYIMAGLGSSTPNRASSATSTAHSTLSSSASLQPSARSNSSFSLIRIDGGNATAKPSANTILHIPSSGLLHTDGRTSVGAANKSKSINALSEALSCQSLQLAWNVGQESLQTADLVPTPIPTISPVQVGTADVYTTSEGVAVAHGILTTTGTKTITNYYTEWNQGTADLNLTLPPNPNCTIGPSACTVLYSSYMAELGLTLFSDSVPYTTPKPTNSPYCGTPLVKLNSAGAGTSNFGLPCSFFGGTVKVHYWPSPTGIVNSSAIVTQVIGNMTYTSPSVYISIDQLTAWTDYTTVTVRWTTSTSMDFSDKQVGSSYSNIHISLRPEDVSTLRMVATDWPAFMSTIANSGLYNYDLIGVGIQGYASTAVPLDVNLISAPSPEAFYLNAGPNNPDYCNAFYDPECNTIFEGAYRPFLAIPKQLLSLDPEWSNCIPGISGEYDPPTALTLGKTVAPAFVTWSKTSSATLAAQPISTAIPPTAAATPSPQPTSATPKSTQSLSEPSSAGGLSAPEISSSAYHSGDPTLSMAGDPTDPENSPDPAKTSIDTPSQHTEAATPVAYTPSGQEHTSANADPSQKLTSPVSPEDPTNTAAGISTTSPPGTAPKQASENALSVLESALSVTGEHEGTDGITKATVDGPQRPTSSSVGIVYSASGSIYSATSVSGGWDVGGTELSAAGPALTANGVIVSAVPDGLVIGTTTIRGSPMPTEPTSIIFTANGRDHTAMMFAGTVVLDGTTLSSDAVLTGDGITAAVSSGRLVVDGTALLDGSGITQMQAASEPTVVLGSQTMVAGGPAVTFGGEAVSVGSTGLVIDGTPIPFQTRTVDNVVETAAVFTINDQVYTATQVQPIVDGNIAGVSAPSNTMEQGALVTVGSRVYTAVNIQAGGQELIELGSVMLTVGGTPQTLSGQIISAAASGLVVDGTTASFSPIYAPAITSAAVFSAGGQLHTVQDIAGALEMDGTSLTASETISVDGQLVSIGSSGIVAGGSTIVYSSVAQPSAAAVLTLDGQLFTAIETQLGTQQLVEIGTLTLTVGGSVATLRGDVLSAATNGLLVQGSTVSFSADPEMTQALLTVDGRVYTAVETRIGSQEVVEIGSLTLLVGGSAATLDGELISAASSGIVVSGSTAAFTTTPGEPSSTTTGNVPLSTSRPTALHSAPAASTTSAAASDASSPVLMLLCLAVPLLIALAA